MIAKLIFEVLRVLIFVIWFFIGAVFWIPFLARMIGVFTISVLSAVSRGTPMGSAELGLEAAVRFYVNGFQKIHEGINNIIHGVRAEEEPKALSSDTVKSLLIQLGYTLAFWTLTVFLLGILSFSAFDSNSKLSDVESTTGVEEQRAIDSSSAEKHTINR